MSLQHMNMNPQHMNNSPNIRHTYMAVFFSIFVIALLNICTKSFSFIYFISLLFYVQDIRKTKRLSGMQNIMLYCTIKHYGRLCNDTCENCNKSDPACRRAEGFCLHGFESGTWQSDQCVDLYMFVDKSM